MYNAKDFNNYISKMNRAGWHLFFVNNPSYDWRQHYTNFQSVHDLFNCSVPFYFDFWRNIMDTRHEFIRWWMNKELICDIMNFGTSPYPVTTLVLEDEDKGRDGSGGKPEQFGEKKYVPKPHPGLKLIQIVRNLQLDNTNLLLVSKDTHSHGFEQIQEVKSWEELVKIYENLGKKIDLSCKMMFEDFESDEFIENKVPRVEIHPPGIEGHPNLGPYGYTLSDMYHSESPIETSKLFIDSLPFNIYVGCDDVSNPPHDIGKKIKYLWNLDMTEHPIFPSNHKIRRNPNVQIPKLEHLLTYDDKYIDLELYFCFTGGGKTKNWSKSAERRWVSERILSDEERTERNRLKYGNLPRPVEEEGILRFEMNIIYIDKKEKYSIPNKNNFKGLSFYFEEDCDLTFDFDVNEFENIRYISKSFLDQGFQNLFYFFQVKKTHFVSENEKVIIFNCGNPIWKYTDKPDGEHFTVLPKKFR